MINRSSTMKEKSITTSKKSSTSDIFHSNHRQNLNHSFANKPSSAHQQEFPIVYSLKPLKYSIPKDVSVVDIFSLLRSKRYEEEKPKAALQLSDVFKAMRRVFIEKMKVFITCERFSYSIVSYAIYYMDLLIAKNAPMPLEHLFIGSMILAVKYYSVETRVYLLKRVQKFLKDTSQKVYDIDELLEIEMQCLINLDYKLNWIHTNHFLQMLLLNGVVFNIDVSYNDKVNGCNIYDVIYEIMDSYYETGHYFAFDKFHLSCAIVTLARELCGFTPWSDFLQRVFSIELRQFEVCLASVKEAYHGQTRSSSPIRKVKEAKPVSFTAVKPKEKEEEEPQIAQSQKSKQIDLMKSADKGLKNRSISFKLYFQDTNTATPEENLNTQRALVTNNTKKRLSVIKENDVNSTEDNSFASMAENFNKTVLLKKSTTNRAKDKPEGILFQHSSKDVLKTVFNGKLDDPKPKGNGKMRLDNDDKINEEQPDLKKEIRKKGTISFSKQFNLRLNTTQDKSYYGDHRKASKLHQANDSDDSFGCGNVKSHRAIQKK